MIIAETESSPEITSSLDPKRLKKLRLNWLSEYSHIDPDSPTDEGYFSPIQEQYLGSCIQEAKKAQEFLDLNLEFDADQQTEAASIIAEGQKAIQALFEVNIPFALMYARASVGIEYPSVVQKIKDKKFTRIAGTAIGTYVPIARLKSPFADLENRSISALEGLWNAAKNFKGDRDAKFITFAAWDIQSRITRDCHSEEHAGVRLPEHRHDEIGTFFRNNPMMDPETMPSSIEQFLAVTSHIEFPSSLTNNEISPDYRNSDDDELDDIADVFGVARGQGYDAEVAFNFADEELWAVLQTLEPIETQVISLRFGLVTGEPLTLDEIGEIIGSSGERVRQIESKAMSKMRHPSRSQTLRDYLSDGKLIDDLSSAYEQQHGRRGDYSLSIGRIAAQMTSNRLYNKENQTPPTLKEYREQEERKDWQAYANEKWESPVRTARYSEVLGLDGVQRIKDILTNAQLYNFQVSFGKAVNTPLPVGLFNRIALACGDKRLTRPQVDEIQGYFENNVMPSMIDALGDDFSLERAEKLFEALHLKLRVPEHKAKNLELTSLHKR